MQRFFLASFPLVFAAACSTTPPVPTVPDALRPDASESLLQTLAARGVQVYECRARKDSVTEAEWVFVAPEADLADAQGRRVGTHYAGPHWESADGSKLVGSVKARADAPVAGAIPWLLLGTRSVGSPGAFARVSSIQRINTHGGVAPPAQECNPGAKGKQARVAYSADYVLFERR